MDRFAGRVAALCAALGYRLLLAPAAPVLLCLGLGQAAEPVAKVAMLEMAVLPMLGAGNIAMDHDLVALVIGIGVPLSLLTAWGWWTFIVTL